MPSAVQLLLLAGLGGVAVVHTASRIAGAAAAAAWCVAALVWGAQELTRSGAFRFLGVALPPWIYVGVLGGLVLFNLGVLVKAWRRRPPPAPSAAAHRDPSPGAS